MILAILVIAANLNAGAQPLPGTPGERDLQEQGTIDVVEQSDGQPDEPQVTPPTGAPMGDAKPEPDAAATQPDAGGRTPDPRWDWEKMKGDVEQQKGPVEDTPNYWGLFWASVGVAALDSLVAFAVQQCADGAEGWDGLGCVASGYGALAINTLFTPAVATLVGDAFGLHGSYSTSLLGSAVGMTVGITGNVMILTTCDDCGVFSSFIPLIVVHTTLTTLGYFVSDPTLSPRSTSNSSGAAVFSLTPTLVPGPDGEVFGGLQFFSVW